ncbi:hypothetical protein [Inquilinus sp.]|jgi:hypothetical protein|uniref:hypothetical protein n=1 Tax=Inquilinus sp. TaxID=1932117 RepID=UPI0037850593
MNRPLPHPRELRANGTLCSRCGDPKHDVCYRGRPAPGHPEPCLACSTSLLRLERLRRERDGEPDYA